MESIIQTEKKCFLCGRNGNGDPLECHHIYGGANRKLSEKDGMKVWLCGNQCHRNGSMSVHRNSYINLTVKQAGQIVWEARYGTREDFMKRYGRNYLE